jgi:predicted GIY-YIG superfamily endonuclease
MSKKNRNPAGYWTKERCKEVASLFNTRSEFSKAYRGAYSKAHRMDWLDGICSHMTYTRKPNNYWTKERCQKEALKYNTRSKFKDDFPSAYKSSKTGGWLDEICSHMEYAHKPNDYWTFERCHEEALKYNTKKEFRVNSSSAYSKTLRKKWVSDICSHMIDIKKPNRYWTKKRCHEEALKYNTKKELQENNSAVSTRAMRKGWWVEITSHMEQVNNIHGYWTFERCHEEALKYNTKKDFRRYGKGARWASTLNGWYDEITSHMKPLPNYLDRYLYQFIFSDGSMYVGITYDINKREKEHLNTEKSSVFKFLKENKGISYELNIIGYYEEFKALEKERELISKLKKNGINLLNKSKGGEIGGIKKHFTKETCVKTALKYKTKKDFKNKDGAIFRFSKRQPWYNEITEHMIIDYTKRKSNRIKKIKKGSKWNLSFDNCKNTALKFKTKTEFKKAFPTIFEHCRKNRWLEKICPHMKQPNIIWDFEVCKNEASKYNSRGGLKKGNQSAYNRARVEGWLDEFFPKNN